MKKYVLSSGSTKKRPNLKHFSAYLYGEWWKIAGIFFIILVNAALNVAAPLLLGKAVDQGITQKNISQLAGMSFMLLLIYFAGLVTNYLQVKLMGNMAQRLLFRLRKGLFTKLQELPLAFFNSNKIGDLISRVNNDTDKLNQFFSEGLVRFTGSFFTILGIAIFIFFLNVQLSLVMLSMSFFLLIVTKTLSPWLKKQNARSLQSVGQLSGDIQEKLNNFRVIAAFNQGQYFFEQFSAFNQRNFNAAKRSAFANNLLTPLYDFANHMAVFLVIIAGTTLIQQQQLTIGILISFMAYSEKFYQPLRILASIWSSIQVSLAAWARIDQIFLLKSDLKVKDDDTRKTSSAIMEFHKVNFGYEEGQKILQHIDLHFEQGKTYAIIGPTGGGKSTLASLMARLYDPVHGHILFNGKSLQSYQPQELVQMIGFILQEPFVFSGTLFENILYGNKELESYSHDDVIQKLQELGLSDILASFQGRLDTKISSQEESISLGQKQLIAFLRIILRKPQLLIMDEATANIDTVTELNLEKIIRNLPKSTTKIIIAHRLNTIKKADEIIFISEGKTQKAMSFEEAMKLIHDNTLKS